MLRTKLAAASLIWSFLLLVVALAVQFAPSGQIALQLKYKTYFSTLVLLPLLALFIWAFYILLTREPDSIEEKSATTAINWLVLYSLYVVMLTGGITRSPLSSLVGIVPLLASPFLNQSRRVYLLTIFLAGVLIVGGLSHLTVFVPPDNYPSVGGWETSGHFNNLIAMFVITCAILIEIKLITLKRAIEEAVV